MSGHGVVAACQGAKWIAGVVGSTVHTAVERAAKAGTWVVDKSVAAYEWTRDTAARGAPGVDWAWCRRVRFKIVR